MSKEKVLKLAADVGFRWDVATSRGYPFLVDKTNVPLMRELLEAIAELEET
jgi:hypothetical protein